MHIKIVLVINIFGILKQ